MYRLDKGSRCTATCPTPATGSSGSPGTAGPPGFSAGGSRSFPGALVPALGLSARLRAADNTIWAGRLRRAGLQEPGSSCCRQLFSCSSSLELLQTERPSALRGGESRQVGAGAPGWLCREGTEMDQTRLLTSAVLERKFGKRQGWSARGRPQAQHPPAESRECLGGWRLALHDPQPGCSPPGQPGEGPRALHKA